MGGKNFLIMTLNSEAIKEIVDRFDNGKTPHIQSEKIKWKKVLVTCKTEKGLIYPMYKESL